MTATAPEVRLGRPRDPACDRAIITATTDLLSEVGYDQLSINEVATRAGVGKATIYRRWPSKIALVVDAFRERAQLRVPVPDTGEVRTDLLSHITAVAAALAGPPGRGISSMLAAAARDEELAAAFHDHFVSARRAVVFELVERAWRRGEIERRPDRDPDVFVDLLVGPVYYRALVTGLPLSPDYLARIVDAALTFI